ncbi:MAG: hypothetical protein K8T89_18855 [Planctomycetes bacterium]|nr:hypothetical protein [Planctomycetota bacterium]
MPPDDLKALREADNLGIADHLEAEGIGYTFLHPKANAMLLREEIGRFSQRYEKLHSAQQRGTVSDYLREIGNDRNTTTSPDIASLAAMLRAGKLPQALAKNSSLGRTSEQVARLLRNHAPPSLPANSLTAKEFLEIQAISKKYNTVIDVVGSRAEGEGRNIYTNFPVDKKEKDGEPPTRSDIDFRIDAAHPQIDDIIEDLKKIGNGAGTAGRDWSTNPATPRGRATKPPFIRFFPD